MPALKEIIEYNDSRGSKIFNGLIEILIVISIISFSIQTLPDLSEKTREYLRILEVIIVIVFTIEYILRIIVADNKLKYIFSFYGLIDLMAILPFYITASIDLRALRMFRLFRLFRVLKLFRYSKAIVKFQNALKLIKDELIVFFFVTCFMIFLSSVGIYYFENSVQPEVFSSVFTSLWWAVSTLTTVGYGDVYPITVGGRIFTFVVLLIALGVVSMPAGILASALSKAREMEE